MAQPTVPPDPVANITQRATNVTFIWRVVHVYTRFVSWCISLYVDGYAKTVTFARAYGAWLLTATCVAALAACTCCYVAWRIRRRSITSPGIDVSYASSSPPLPPSLETVKFTSRFIVPKGTV